MRIEKIVPVSCHESFDLQCPVRSRSLHIGSTHDNCTVRLFGKQFRCRVEVAALHNPSQGR